MFKILPIGRKTGMSDDRLEEGLVRYRALMRFTGKNTGDAVPDRTTIASYPRKLGDDAVREIFDLFKDQLSVGGIRRQRRANG